MYITLRMPTGKNTTSIPMTSKKNIHPFLFPFFASATFDSISQGFIHCLGGCFPITPTHLCFCQAITCFHRSRIVLKCHTTGSGCCFLRGISKARRLGESLGAVQAAKRWRPKSGLHPWSWNMVHLKINPWNFGDSYWKPSFWEYFEVPCETLGVYSKIKPMVFYLSCWFNG